MSRQLDRLAYLPPTSEDIAVRGSCPPLLVAGIYGALLVTAADLVARMAPGVDLPVGIVTAVVGAPYLLYLLARRNRKVTG